MGRCERGYAGTSAGGPQGSATLWAVFEWLARRVEEGHVRAYTLAEAQALCTQAGLHVVNGKAFPIDWFWRGWALRVDSIVSVC